MGPEIGTPVSPGTDSEALGPGDRDFLCDQFTFYSNFDYLLWHINNPVIPATATLTPTGVLAIPTGFTLTATVNAAGVATFVPTPTPQTLVSVAAQNGAGVAGPINIGDNNGGRITLGFWCDPERWLGFEAQGFWLEKLGYGNVTVFNNNNNATNQLVVNTGVVYSQPGVVIPGTATNTTSTILPGATTPVVLLGTSAGSISNSISEVMAGGEFNARSTGLTFANTRSACWPAAESCTTTRISPCATSTA